MPFLDYRLAEFLSSVPACYKVHAGWTKYIARLALNGILPDDVVWRRDKMGWPIPERFWFSYGLKSWYLSSINNSDVVTSLKNHVKLDLIPEHAPRSLKVLNIAAWARIFKVVIR
jgi:asparagine synthase (glutamine-hydrolysing)